MEIRKRKKIKVAAAVNVLFISLFSLLISKIHEMNGKYFSLDDLLKYELVERDGECNVFINGFNEKMKLCPEDFYVDDNGVWKDVKNIADYRGY